MLGLMQDHPLLISSIFEHAVGNYGKQEIVSNTVEGGIDQTFKQLPNCSNEIVMFLHCHSIRVRYTAEPGRLQ